MKKYASLLLTIVIIYSFRVHAQNCDMYLTSCPENYNNTTITVPKNIVALYPRIYTCDASSIIEGIIDAQSPPSIVFVIDHSYSMMGLGNTNPGNDVYGARFNVTRDLIDTIYSKYPNAEIGVVVYREVLYFDHRNNPLFKQLTNQGDQSYLPLLQLNKMVDGNTTGLEAIKSVLQTDTVVKYNEKYKLNVKCADLIYTPQFTTVGNTNINNAFAAALEAMSSSTNPKNRQFIVFLSDGEPHPLDTSQQGGKDPYYFAQGVATPTTFTVYLHNTETQAPASLQTMTTNIKLNNYSAINGKSDIWLLKSNYDALMSLFMNRIMYTILSVASGNATVLSVNNISSTVIDDSGFVFSERFPLQNDSTDFEIKISYQLKNTATGLESDTQTITTFTVVRKDGAVLPSDISAICDFGTRLAFYYNGVKIDAAQESMEKIEVRLESSSTIKAPVTVEISNVFSAPNDLVKIDLKQTGIYWNEQFARQINSTQPADKILQHQAVDSIIAIYRNPLLTSGLVRASIPFSKLVASQTPFSLVAGAINNPSTPVSTVPEVIRNEYIAANRLDAFKERGIVLAIVPDKFFNEELGLSGEVSIYDVVKNTMVEKAPMVVHNNKLFFIWDCTNTNSRKVATGTYMAVFTITDSNKQKENKSLRIGVKR